MAGPPAEAGVGRRPQLQPPAVRAARVGGRQRGAQHKHGSWGVGCEQHQGTCRQGWPAAGG